MQTITTYNPTDARALFYKILKSLDKTNDIVLIKNSHHRTIIMNEEYYKKLLIEIEINKILLEIKFLGKII